MKAVMDQAGPSVPGGLPRVPLPAALQASLLLDTAGGGKKKKTPIKFPNCFFYCLKKNIFDRELLST